MAVAVVAIVLGLLLGSATGIVMSGKALQLTFSVELELITGLAVIAWLTLVHKGGLQSLGIRFDLRDIGAGAAGGAVINVVALWLLGTVLLFIIKAITGSTIDTPQQLPARLDAVQVLLAGLFVVSAAFGEELFFRGLIFRGLRGRFNFWTSAGVTSAFFGAVHFSGLTGGSYLLMGTMFFVGFGFAGIYEWRQNILANMTSHAVFNLISFLALLATMSR